MRYKTLIMIRSLRSEQASTYRNIKPFADLIGGLIEIAGGRTDRAHHTAARGGKLDRFTACFQLMRVRVFS